MTVWNTIDETYSVVPLYSNEATFLDFASFESIFSMTVWNTSDDTYSISPLYRNEATFLAFARFQSIFIMTVWNTIDDRYSNVVLYLEMKPHFLIFCFFSKHFHYGRVESYR